MTPTYNIIRPTNGCLPNVMVHSGQ